MSTPMKADKALAAMDAAFIGLGHGFTHYDFTKQQREDVIAALFALQVFERAAALIAPFKEVEP